MNDRALLTQPKISIIITAFNRKEFLLDAVKSISNQTASSYDYEVIILKNFKDEFIDNLAISLGFRNIFYGGTFGEMLAKGLSECNGEIATFLDDDDLYSPERISHILSVFESYQNIGYFHNNSVYFTSNGQNNRNNTLSRVFYKAKYDSFYVLDVDKNILLNRMEKIGADFNLSSIAIRLKLALPWMDLIAKCPSFPDGLIFFLALISEYDIYIDCLRLTSYRYHKRSTSYWFAVSKLRIYSIEQIVSNMIDQKIKPEILEWLKIKLVLNKIIMQFHKHPMENRSKLFSLILMLLKVTGVQQILFPEVLKVMVMGVLYFFFPKSSIHLTKIANGERFL